MKDFVAIDFETANYEPTSICSVGLVVVRGGEITQSMHRLVCPEPDYYIRRFPNKYTVSIRPIPAGLPRSTQYGARSFRGSRGYLSLPITRLSTNGCFGLPVACMASIIPTGHFSVPSDRRVGLFPARPLPITGYLRFVPIWVFPSTAITMHLPMPKAVRALPSVCGETKNKKRSRYVRLFLPIYLRMVENPFLLSYLCSIAGYSYTSLKTEMDWCDTIGMVF